MKISEMIKHLQAVKRMEGDVECWVYCDCEYREVTDFDCEDHPTDVAFDIDGQINLRVAVIVV